MAARSPKQARSKALRTALLDATEQLLARDGLASSTVSSIVERAGTSTASLYQYFASKDELIRAVRERRIQTGLEAFERDLEELRDLPPSDLIAKVVARRIDRMRTQVDLLTQLQLDVPSLRPSAVDTGVMRRASQLFASGLERHRSQLAVADLHLAATLVVHTVTELTRSIVLTYPEYREQSAAADEIVRLVSGYLGLSADAEP